MIVWIAVVSGLVVALVGSWIYHRRMVRLLVASQPTRRPVVVVATPRQAVSLVTYTVTLVAELYGVAVDDIFSDRRTQPVAQARQVAMRVVRECSDLSLSQIGYRFDRHHTTVMHGIEAAAVWDLSDIIAVVQQAFPDAKKQ